MGSVSLPATQPLLKASHGDVVVGTAGFWASVFNMMNAIMGTGVLGLAYSMNSCGIVLFSILLIAMVMIADYSIRLLLVMCKITGVTSYEQLGWHALSGVGKIVTCLVILLQNIGSMISYLVVVGDLLPDVVRTLMNRPKGYEVEWYLSRDFLLSMSTLVVVLPLSYTKTIGFLGYVSAISFVFVLLFAGTVIAKMNEVPCPLPGGADVTGFWSSDFEGSCAVDLIQFSESTFYAIPTIAFSFQCHTVLLPTYTDLKHRTQPRMQAVTRTALLACFLIYYLVALFGYLTFYSKVESDLLQSYSLFDPNNILIAVVRGTYAIATILTVPLLCFPARRAIDFMFFEGSQFSWKRHISFSTSIVVVSLLAALFIPNIKDVFGLVGATSAVSLIFILPGLFYTRIQTGDLLSSRKLGAVTLFVLGIIVGVSSVVGIIVSWI